MKLVRKLREEKAAIAEDLTEAGIAGGMVEAVAEDAVAAIAETEATVTAVATADATDSNSYSHKSDSRQISAFEDSIFEDSIAHICTSRDSYWGDVRAWACCRSKSRRIPYAMR